MKKSIIALLVASASFGSVAADAYVESNTDGVSKFGFTAPIGESAAYYTLSVDSTQKFTANTGYTFADEESGVSITPEVEHTQNKNTRSMEVSLTASYSLTDNLSYYVSYGVNKAETKNEYTGLLGNVEVKKEIYKIGTAYVADTVTLSYDYTHEDVGNSKLLRTIQDGNNAYFLSSIHSYTDEHEVKMAVNNSSTEFPVRPYVSLTHLSGVGSIPEVKATLGLDFSF